MTSMPLSDLAVKQASADRRMGPRNDFIPWTRRDMLQSMSDRFEQQVAKYAGRVAIKTEDRPVTYDELNRAANRLAHAILAERGPRQEGVALFLEHGLSAVVAILAVLKAGKFYVPMDLHSPRERVEHILADSQAGLILTTGDNVPALAGLAGPERSVLNVDGINGRFSDDNPGLSVSPDSPAVLLYTSGSTGEPKGVVRTHRSSLHSRMVSANACHICADDRVAFIASYSFANSMSSIFGPLLNGAASFPFDIAQQGLPNLAGWLLREEITVLAAVPTVFRNLARTLGNEETFPKLRLVSLGGETVHPSDVDLFKKHFSDDCLLRVVLAMTEAGVVASLFIDKNTEITGEVVPAGYVPEDIEVVLLDDGGNEVTFDCVGEIAVRSRYLASGYWRKPERTALAFVPVPGRDGLRLYRTGDLGRMSPDGCLVHLGRKDFQVKVRGHRIETREVEEVLLGIDGVSNAAVVARSDGQGDMRLVAYVEPVGRPVLTVSGLRKLMSDRLHAYKVPTTFVFMDRLPLTVSGKVDRVSLPEPGASRPQLDVSFVAPRTPMEKQLADIWSRILDVSPVGIHDSFFDLGGHSLLAARLFTEIRNTSGKTLPLATLAGAPTVAELARVVEKEEWSAPGACLVALQPKGSKVPFFCAPGAAMDVIHFTPLARSLGDDQPFYAFQPLGLDGPQAPHTRVEDMAAQYISEMRTVQPEGPYLLGGRCMGGLVALEMAHQLRAQGQRVGLIALLDSSQPPPSISLREYLRYLFFHHLPRGQFLFCVTRDIRERMRAAKLKLTLGRKRRRLLRVWQANNEARHTYVAEPFPGRLTMFQSSEFSLRFPQYQARWAALAGEGMDLHIVPGGHRGLFREPCLAIVTETLTSCFAAATQ